MPRITINSSHEVWVGTEASYNEYLATEARISALEESGKFAEDATTEVESLPYLLDKQGSIGVITISGSLSNKESWYDKYLSVPSYPAIRDALLVAAEDPEIEQILLSINSGGGGINGLGDTGQLISLVNSIKPVTAYTDGMMCSAAYWLACSAGEVYASNISDVGSIGVITTHLDYSQQLKQDGVKATIIRSGQYKALNSPLEPLSDTAKQLLQDQLDTVYKIFVQYVAENRNQPYDYVESNMAQGRVFVGQQAQSVGLVDGVTGFDALMTKLQQKTIDNQKQSEQTTAKSSKTVIYGATDMAKRTLTTQEVAAIASGAQVSAAEDTITTETSETVETETNAAAETTTTDPVVNADQKVTEIPNKSDSELVTFLKAELKAAQTEIVTINAEVTRLKAAETDVTDLIGIAAASVNHMQIALGGSAFDYSKVSAKDIVQKHAEMSSTFVSKYKAGGVAAVDATQEETPKSGVDHMFYARVQAAGATPKAK